MKTQEQVVVHNTFAIERSYPVSPQRVFAAFADPAKKQRWFARGENHEIESYELDFRVGGKEQAHFRFKEGSPFPGVALSNSGIYLDIVDNRRIVAAYTMTIGEHLMSASLLTIELVAAEKGTDMLLTHQGAFFEHSDGPEMREAGWRKLIDRLGAELDQ